MRWRIMPRITMPDEENPAILGRDDSLMREMEREEWQELERQAQRDEWDKKHPRCDACGQFLGGKAHFVQDYWGEWDHI